MPDRSQTSFAQKSKQTASTVWMQPRLVSQRPTQPKLHDMHKHRMSWISVSRYKMSHLSLMEQVHTELRDLGAIEIMIGMIEMMFGIPLIFAESYSFPAIIGVPWFTGFWYVVAGSLTVHLVYSRRPVGRWAIFMIHLITANFAVAGCVIFNLSLFYLPTTPFNFFMAAPMINAAFLMIFSVVEFIISCLICYLHIKLLRSSR
ncbi:membrane-spanning 4-domains subfamily A member 18-like isoform X2 [Stegostoma tigrinum]|uniref:membrane-spanning 4-domains subfamily A member 18-like isoform X2 n=1 Tax=Stegostoma tigrinum TaxID=3053191 RepID=UPI00202B94E5|nr:membrane-spanning 4-domains subfamily A member 18-like isoform X2 [Stegostoma tigrinum]